MHTKIIAGIITAIVIALLGVISIMQFRGNDSSAFKTDASSVEIATYRKVDACSILTEEIASAVLGEIVSKDQSGQNESSNDSIQVSSCSYATKFTVGEADSLRTVGLLARSAKDAAGARSNAEQFGVNLPQGVVKVAGYGDSAYWEPTFHQLNILKRNNWYILTNGPSSLEKRTLSETRTFADKIIDRL